MIDMPDLYECVECEAIVQPGNTVCADCESR